MILASKMDPEWNQHEGKINPASRLGGSGASENGLEIQTRFFVVVEATL